MKGCELMVTDAKLADVALGELGPASALAVVSAVLGSANPNANQRVYTALRAWVWKALDRRRRDAELRDWYDVLRRVESYWSSEDKSLAQSVAVLSELIQESITVSERFSVEDVVQRRHVREILKLLTDAHKERLERAAIGEKLGLKQGNLTRVLNMVTDAGLAERTSHGKHAELQLTRAGKAEAERLGYRRIPEPKVRRRLESYQPLRGDRNNLGNERARLVMKNKRTGYSSHFSYTKRLEATKYSMEKFRPSEVSSHGTFLTTTLRRSSATNETNGIGG